MSDLGDRDDVEVLCGASMLGYSQTASSTDPSVSCVRKGGGGALPTS